MFKIKSKKIFLNLFFIATIFAIDRIFKIYILNIDELKDLILNYEDLEYSCEAFKNLKKLKVWK